MLVYKSESTSSSSHLLISGAGEAVSHLTTTPPSACGSFLHSHTRIHKSGEHYQVHAKTVENVSQTGSDNRHNKAANKRQMLNLTVANCERHTLLDVVSA